MAQIFIALLALFGFFVRATFSAASWGAFFAVFVYFFNDLESALTVFKYVFVTCMAISTIIAMYMGSSK